jgi:hypothetical protein
MTNIQKENINEQNNLQVLCKKCHFEKTQTEHEQGYIKLSLTESSFNTTVKNIFNSDLNKKYAFIEKLKETIPTKLSKNKIHFFDLVRCRRTAMCYNQFEYPLFTVMDKPTEYKGQTGAGLYYVETAQYFPFRGFGWYSYPLIKYGLDNDLIKPEEIKYVVESSLEVPYDYYNKFIDYLYDSILAEPDEKPKNGCYNLGYNRQLLLSRS